jgi:hypothetical protein
MKSLVIVADKKEMFHAKSLSHAITKAKLAKVVVWSPKTYEDNLDKKTGDNHYIFIGRSKVANDYVKILQVNHKEPKFKKHGGVWDYDHKKAVIYIDSHTKISLDELNKETAKHRDRINEYSEESSISLMCNIFFKFFFVYSPIEPESPMSRDIYKYVKSRLTKKPRLRDIQYCYTMLDFISNGFQQFIDQE